MAVSFKRTECWLGGRSWSWRVFVEHQTELNSMYWSYVPLSSVGRYWTKALASEAAVLPVFYVAGPDAKRVPATVERWRRADREFGNWVRLSAVMGVSAYLETYLRSAVGFAVMSDPGVLVGAPGSIDGVQLRLKGRRVDAGQIVTACTKGDWYSRRRAFSSVFGAMGGLTDALTRELEQVRLLRNAVGHYFGRSPKKTEQFWVDGDAGSQRVSQERLQKIFGTIEVVADIFDGHLLPHMGNIETIHAFLTWKADALKTNKVSYAAMAENGADLFVKHLAKHHDGRSPGKAFVKEMLAYIHEVEREAGVRPLR